MKYFYFYRQKNKITRYGYIKLIILVKIVVTLFENRDFIKISLKID